MGNGLGTERTMLAEPVSGAMRIVDRVSDVQLAAPPIGGDLFRPGELLGGAYEIRQKIGEGGMGQVYEAYDVLLRRRVAIKASRPEMQASVVHEARALAAMRHPTTVTVHALGVHEGTEYVVMELLLGETLEAHLERRIARSDRLTIREILRILAGIADGLAVVHQAGIAHRDVKPGNVMLAPNDRVVLTDFGVFQPEIEFSSATLCAGSPRYMAPEAATTTIARGQLFLVDIYALGVIAFELLIGKVPFDHFDVGMVLWMHAQAPLPRLAGARADAPPQLIDLVEAMLAKQPSARPQSADEIAWELRRLLAPSSGPISR